MLIPPPFHRSPELKLRARCRYIRIHVQAIIRCFRGGMGGQPVTVNKSTEAKLAFQDLVQSVVIFASICAIDLVVRAHDGASACFHRSRKWPKIYFVQSTIINFGRVLYLHICYLCQYPDFYVINRSTCQHSVGFLIIGDEMLCSCDLITTFYELRRSLTTPWLCTALIVQKQLRRRGMDPCLQKAKRTIY